MSIQQRRIEPSPWRRWLASLFPHEPSAAPAASVAPAAAPPDVEALVQARTAEVRAALKAAQSASRAKSQFLANLGHEIRTPMNGVMGMAQLLAATGLDTTQRGYVDLMQRSAASLLGLVDQLLDFARIEAGEVELKLEPVALRPLLDDVAASVWPLAHNKRLLFECRLATDLPAVVRADAVRLRQVALVLLSNALKFTSVGQVVLAARAQAGHVVLEVADTGIGMPPEQHEQVFAPFTQLEDGMARRHGGIGLGLAIADALVRAMDGRIEVDSASGRGAVFTVRLPLPVLQQATARFEHRHRAAVVSDAPASQDALCERLLHLGHGCVAKLSWRDLAFAPEALAAQRPEVVLYDEPLAGWPHHAPLAASSGLPWQVLLIERTAGSAGRTPLQRLRRPTSDAELERALEPREAPDAALQSAAPGPRRHVLLVEDHEINRVVARSFLEHLGFEVDVAADATAAFSALASRDYCAILMDCQMPGMDGYELTRRIRAGEAGARAQRAPIIALTAHATPADREQCLAAGMNDYLAKPVTAHQLSATIERWLVPGR